jgi:deoxyribose-phosphate aldolase
MTSTSSPADTKRLLSVLDATLLDPQSTEDDIRAFCEKIGTAPVASVIVLPQWVALTRSLVPATIPVGTVLNFPGGENSAEDVVEEALQAVKDGATELDVVIPYDSLPYDDGFATKTMIADVVEASPGILVKAILETGALADAKAIRQAAGAAVSGGADFLKTSTGVHPVGATPEAVQVLLDFMMIYPGKVGIKISGGVRSIDNALAYWEQAEQVMGAHWCHRKRFRLGASRLLDDVLNAPEPEETPDLY